MYLPGLPSRFQDTTDRINLPQLFSCKRGDPKADTRNSATVSRVCQQKMRIKYANLSGDIRLIWLGNRMLPGAYRLTAAAAGSLRK